MVLIIDRLGLVVSWGRGVVGRRWVICGFGCMVGWGWVICGFRLVIHARRRGVMVIVMVIMFNCRFF